MKFELEKFHRNIPDGDLIADVNAVARQLGRDTVAFAEYNNFGKFTSTTLRNRFGSWSKALESAGLAPSRYKGKISPEDLLEKMRDVWTKLARQPRKEEMRTPLSRHTAGPYQKSFGSWRKALEAFIRWIETPENEDAGSNASMAPADLPRRSKASNRTIRNISERLRFRILVRDGFACQTCAKSPLASRGVEVHVDHIVPWSKGGETIPEIYRPNAVSAILERATRSKGNYVWMSCEEDRRDRKCNASAMLKSSADCDNDNE